MQDKDLYENVLNGTKLLSGILMHGSLESSDDEINKTFIKASQNILEIQHKVYKKMEEENWYKMEYVKETAITKVLNKHNQEN